MTATASYTAAASGFQITNPYVRGYYKKLTIQGSQDIRGEKRYTAS
jgi:hypothetical protein